MNTSKIYEILGIPFGFVISLFYAMTDNYLLSIVCLMIIVKLCLLPSSVKQQRLRLSRQGFSRSSDVFRKIRGQSAENSGGNTKSVQPRGL